MGSPSVQGITLWFAPQESSIICRINGQDGFWSALQSQLVILAHCLDPMVPWGVTPESVPTHPESPAAPSSLSPAEALRAAKGCEIQEQLGSPVPPSEQPRSGKSPRSVAQTPLHLTWPALVGSNEVLVCPRARVRPKDLAVHQELAPLLVLALSQQLLESKAGQM